MTVTAIFSTTLGTLKLLNILGAYEIIYGIKEGGFSGHYIKMKCHNVIERTVANKY